MSPILMFLLAIVACAGQLPAGGALEREQRAQVQALDVEPGEVAALLERYPTDIERAVVLEHFQMALANPRVSWTPQDLAALEKAAAKAARSHETRLRRAGAVTLAMSRFLLTEPGGLPAYLADEELDPQAVLHAVYWCGSHRGRVTRWAPADIDAMHAFLTPLAIGDGPTVWKFVEFLAQESHSSGKARAWWRDDLADAEAAMWMRALARGLDKSWTQVGDEPRRARNDLPGLDFWLERAMAAPPGSRLRGASQEALARRCTHTPPPTTFSCP